jgi:hypothetical protein
LGLPPPTALPGGSHKGNGWKRGDKKKNKKMDTIDFYRILKKCNYNIRIQGKKINWVKQLK